VWEMQRDDEAATKDLSAVLDEKNRPNLGTADLSYALAAKGWIMFARDRAGDARAAFDEAVKVDPRNVSALVGQGEVLYADGRFTEALTRFDEAVSKDPTSTPALLGSAKTKIGLERLADAKTQLTAARQTAPKDMNVALWLARTEEALGNKAAAEELYSTAVDLADPQNPDAVNAYAAAATFLASQGKMAEAAAKLEQARGKLPDTAALRRAFGEVAVAQGQFAEALEHFEAALQKNPNDLGTRFRLGVTYRRMHKLDLAAQALDQVAAIDKEYPGIALERGLLFEDTGELQMALEQFQSALQKSPKDIDLMLRVGAAYVAIGDIEKALPLLDEVKKARPNSAEANHFVGRAYLKLGGTEGASAMRYLQRAVALDPNKAEYHLYVAWAANESTPAQLGLARTHIDKALALDKLLADGYWQRGVLLRKEAQVNDAIKDLKRALELKPSRHEAHAALAEAYEDKNDVAAASIEWQKAIAGDPKAPLWHWRYGKLLAERHQNAEAAKHLVFAVEKGKSVQPRPGWLGPAAFEAGEALRKTRQKKEACEHYSLYMELAGVTSPDRRDALRAQSELGCPTEER
ncbi:MAG TPA: tetratricopeptide repeat protein, partial [Labilithrix sp.]|nr:tetratricopeptide repeat protein [Labilithrix sp.]